MLHRSILRLKWLYLNTIVILLLSGCHPNIHQARDLYPGGQPKYKGKYIECQSNDPTYPTIIVNEKRKFGEWTSFHPNGNLKEVRHYTDKVVDCQTEILKQGIWKYYNRDGILYLTEEYRNDTLIHAVIDVYEGTTPIGEVIKRAAADDSVIWKVLPQTNQLLPNAGFNQFYHKPIFLANDGYDQIETLIPGWYSPDKATPDYYHTFRTLEGVPPHFQSNIQTHNGYVGLMLYLGEVNSRFIPPDYTETIQTNLREPLQKEETYCFKVKVRLSGNSGFSIDRLGILFSAHAMTFNNTTSMDSASISFTEDLDNRDRWKTLCAPYTAEGGESYLTIGRFASNAHVTSRSHPFKQKSTLNINESAYYLLDDVELYRVADSTECFCETASLSKNEPETSTNEFTIGDTIVLSSIQFAFDSYTLNPESFHELEKLAAHMQSSPELKVEIIGHTDNTGTDTYNQQLSERRANAVRQWLIDNGVSEDRIVAKGVGNQYPINSDIPNSQLNRRVEVLLRLD